MPRQLSITLLLFVIFLAGVFFETLPAQVTSSSPSENTDQMRDLNGYFPMDVPSSLEAWKSRREQLQTHLKVVLGLFPEPPRNPLKVQIHGKITKPGYTIEKVYFESLPGFYVTGNLYRPERADGKVPGILCPHGHFQQGRFNHEQDNQIKASIDSGAESFPDNARSILQARCANLARMGSVVFHYDMIGYADSTQLSFELAHRFAKQRPELNRPERWGLFSPQAEVNLQSVMGLQTWNSIRAIDFLCTLPDVDPERIGVTGASGGGTQTFMVCAVDDRPAAAFPAVMVSTAMQGGCTCENCSLLRVGTGNVEIAALFAPKPLAMTAANDWTREMETKGMPELKSIYQMYGKPENVQLTSRVEFGHNYNQVSREAMYRWFKTHLGLQGEPVERPIEFVDPSDLSVFDQQHPRPDGGLEFETQLTRQMKSSSDQQLKETLFAESANPEDFDRWIGTYVDVAMQTAVDMDGIPQPDGTELVSEFPTVQRFHSSDRHDNQLTLEQIVHPQSRANLLLIDGSNLYASNEAHPNFLFARQAEEYAFSVTTFKHGGINWEQLREAMVVANPREALCYTLGYNAPQLTRRASAWLNMLDRLSGQPVFVVALDQGAAEAGLSADYLATLRDVHGIAIDTGGFRFQQIDRIRDPQLLPGGAKYFDLPGLISLAAPKPLLVISETEESAPIIRQSYRVSGALMKVQFAGRPDRLKERNRVILDWIDAQLPKSD